LFSPCDSALTVLTSDAINLSKFIEASEQRLQSRYFSDTPRICLNFTKNQAQYAYKHYAYK